MNEVLLNYLKAYKDKYPLEALKEKMLSKGYPQTEIEEAIQVIQQEETLYQPPTNKNTQTNSSQTLFKPKTFTPQQLERTTKMTGKTNKKSSGIMNIAGILGLLLFTTIIILTTLRFLNQEEFLNNNTLLTIGILSTIAYTIYLLGITKLGTTTEEKTLKNAAITKILILLSFIGISTIFLITKKPTQGIIEQFTITWILIYTGLFIAHLITKYLYATGLKATGKNIPLAKKAGNTNLTLAIIYTLYFIGTLYLAFDTALLNTLSNTNTADILANTLLAGTILLNALALLLESLTPTKNKQIKDYTRLYYQYN